jgi:hypothetical protein
MGSGRHAHSVRFLAAGSFLLTVNFGGVDTWLQLLINLTALLLALIPKIPAMHKV